VRKRIEERGSEIMLNLGFYPYLDYEPMSFWGNNKRIWEVMRMERWRGGEY
jgi:dTDP-6-deoxy-L-talose 4-dehydrogenase (NAD+)